MQRGCSAKPSCSTLRIYVLVILRPNIDLTPDVCLSCDPSCPSKPTELPRGHSLAANFLPAALHENEVSAPRKTRLHNVIRTSQKGSITKTVSSHCTWRSFLWSLSIDNATNCAAAIIFGRDISYHLIDANIPAAMRSLYLDHGIFSLPSSSLVPIPHHLHIF